MGMYNLIFGKNRNAKAILNAIGLTEDDFYRFRDCYINKKQEIAVYTRGGGSNRDCFCDDPDIHEDGCVVPIQLLLCEHPLYLRDEDDDFDNTYATFYFRMPEESWLKNVPSEIDKETLWKIFLDALKNKK